jgi:hypothetical protein
MTCPHGLARWLFFKKNPAANANGGQGVIFVKKPFMLIVTKKLCPP